MIHITYKPTPSFFTQLPLRTYQLGKIRAWLTLPPEERGHPPSLQWQHTRIPELMQAIGEMFANKCVFCETQLASDEQQLMFFRPPDDTKPQNSTVEADHYYWLSWDWSNFYLACSECFALRGSKFPVEKQRVNAHVSHLDRENATLYFQEEKPLLLDPRIEIPIKCLDFHENGEITARDRSLRGKQTIEIFGLNRDQLVKVRKQEAQQLKATWLEARRQMIERAGNVDNALVETLTAACKPSAQFAGMKAYLLLEWLISETRIALDSADLFERALDKEPWRHLHHTAMSTLRLEKPRSVFDQPDSDDAQHTVQASTDDRARTEVAYIYIQGDMYQVGTISHSTVAIGRNASSSSQR